jgi:uncharacterized protein (DUF488 family)
VTKLYTIGYVRGALSDVIAALRRAGVKTVLDIRELPNSRRAGFSRRMLDASLDEAGIAYKHLRALGTPKAGRDAAKRGDNATMRRIFEAKLETPESQLALIEAAQIAKNAPACLLCLEHDWRACHRAIVAERLAAHGLKAAHLTPDAMGRAS